MLWQALPEYYDAIKALDSLDKKDIQEVPGWGQSRYVELHAAKPCTSTSGRVVDLKGVTPFRFLKIKLVVVKIVIVIVITVIIVVIVIVAIVVITEIGILIVIIVSPDFACLFER